MVSLYPCQKTKSDAKIAFSWRNDRKTIASSYITIPKTWDSFWMEYSECYFIHPDFSPMFILDGGTPVGFIRFEKVDRPEYPQKTIAEVMINVAPEHRGQGIASEALYILKQTMRQKDVFALLADIRKTNKGSICLFEKAGFDFFNERTEYISQTKENCCIVCYLCFL